MGHIDLCAVRCQVQSKTVYNQYKQLSVNLMKSFNSDGMLETSLRSIYLLGANTATYKFALVQSLLDLKGTDKTFISLDDLTPIYADHLLRHIKTGNKQINRVGGSPTIHAIHDYSKGNLSESTMLNIVRIEGFKIVIDALHNLPQKQKAIPLYQKAVQDNKQGLILTDEMFEIFSSADYGNFKNEVESRWTLVETVWGEQGVFRINFDRDTQEMYYLKPMSNEEYLSNYVRKPLTHLRNPFNGYQKGKCFYCNRHIDIEPNKENTCQVDHFLPHHLMRKTEYQLDLDEIWNLVLACKECNGFSEKGGRMPAKNILPKLADRNEYLIESHLPIKETIISICGKTKKARYDFLNKRYEFCRAIKGAHSEWSPKFIYAPDF